MAQRLLQDPTPQLRRGLIELLFKDGTFRWNRLENLLRESGKSEDSTSDATLAPLLEILLSEGEGSEEVRELVEREAVRVTEAMLLGTALDAARDDSSSAGAVARLLQEQLGESVPALLPSRDQVEMLRLRAQVLRVWGYIQERALGSSLRRACSRCCVLNDRARLNASRLGLRVAGASRSAAAALSRVLAERRQARAFQLPRGVLNEAARRPATRLRAVNCAGLRGPRVLPRARVFITVVYTVQNMERHGVFRIGGVWGRGWGRLGGWAPTREKRHTRRPERPLPAPPPPGPGRGRAGCAQPPPPAPGARRSGRGGGSAHVRPARGTRPASARGRPSSAAGRSAQTLRPPRPPWRRWRRATTRPFRRWRKCSRWWSPAGGGRVFLGMKKRGPGTGKWNGFGGKVERGEPVAEGAEREFREETGGALAINLQRLGVLTFHGVCGDTRSWEVHLFSADGVEGDFVETDEMAGAWHDVDSLDALYDHMWPDDRIWYPFLLQRKPFVLEAWFGGSKGEEMLRHTIEETIALPEISLPWE